MFAKYLMVIILYLPEHWEIISQFISKKLGKGVILKLHTELTLQLPRIKWLVQPSGLDLNVLPVHVFDSFSWHWGTHHYFP